MTYIIGFFFIVELEGSFWSIMLPLSAVVMGFYSRRGGTAASVALSRSKSELRPDLAATPIGKCLN